MSDKKRALGFDEKYCRECGSIIKKEAEICPKCGLRLKNPPFITNGSNAGILSFLDRKGTIEYLYPKNEVYNALLEAISNIKGFKIEKKDESGGKVLVKAGVSIWSWGENIPISVIEIWSGRTRVEIVSTPKTGILFGGALDFGKNKENIELIINETSKILSTKHTV
jgi:hypothetical protein